MVGRDSSILKGCSYFSFALVDQSSPVWRITGK